jgi:hypothetical protein
MSPRLWSIDNTFEKNVKIIKPARDKEANYISRLHLRYFIDALIMDLTILAEAFIAFT